MQQTMTRKEYADYIAPLGLLRSSKAEYETALTQPLLMKVEGKSRLTLDGILVCEYGIEKSMLQPELSVEQQQQVIWQHFPEGLRLQEKEALEEAVFYYQESLLFSDDELGLT